MKKIVLSLATLAALSGVALAQPERSGHEATYTWMTPSASVVESAGAPLVKADTSPAVQVNVDAGHGRIN